MAGSIEGIKRALEAVADRQLCEFGRPGPDGGTRVPVTGAIILGVLDEFEEQVARLEAERDELLESLRTIRRWIEVLFTRIPGSSEAQAVLDGTGAILARYDEPSDGGTKP